MRHEITKNLSTSTFLLLSRRSIARSTINPNVGHTDSYHGTPGLCSVIRAVIHQPSKQVFFMHAQSPGSNHLPHRDTSPFRVDQCP